MKRTLLRLLILPVVALCASCAGPTAVPFQGRLVTDHGTLAYTSKGGFAVTVDGRSGK